MNLTPTELCALFLILSGLLHWLRIFARTRAVLALIAVAGIGGFVGRALVAVAGWLQHLTGTVTGWALGAAVPAALFIGLAVILVYDLHPNGGGISRRTSWVAIGAGVLLVAGVSGIPALAPAAAALRSLPADITNFVNTL